MINKKSESTYLMKTEGRTRFRVIINAEDVKKRIQELYPDVKVEVIEVAYLSFKEQLKLMLDTTLFISHPGGSAMSLPFIAKGSTAILVDYPANENDRMFAHAPGDTVSMEVSFWNLWPHFTKMYYQIYSLAFFFNLT